MITDGKANGNVDVKPEAAKWKAAVDHIYALGFDQAEVAGENEVMQICITGCAKIIRNCFTERKICLKVTQHYEIWIRVPQLVILEARIY